MVAAHKRRGEAGGVAKLGKGADTARGDPFAVDRQALHWPGG